MSDYSKIELSIKRELETIKVIGNNPDDAVEEGPAILNYVI